VASLIAVGVIVGIDPLHTLLIILLSVSATVLFAAFGLVINLMMPRFDWANEMAAAKQGGSTIVSVLCSMLIALIISAAAALPTLFLDCGVGMIISTIICLGASALLCLYLVRSGGKRFECLQSDS
jgi:ABC-2 type transport system permease protein